MNHNKYLPIHKLIMSVAHATKIVDQAVFNHHQQVAYTTLRLARKLEYQDSSIHNLLVASLLHDIGMFAIASKIELLKFEYRHTKHADIGASLLEKYPFFPEAAPIIRYHHLAWQDGEGEFHGERSVPEESHLLHLSDRVSLMVDDKSNILDQKNNIINYLEERTPTVFKQKDLKALKAMEDDFWFSLVNPVVMRIELEDEFTKYDGFISKKQSMDLAKFYSKIIDYRSKFTSTHSLGVAKTARHLANKLGWPKEDLDDMELAGYLHDLGKLAIPSDILNKKGSLSESEYNLIKSHTYHTYHILHPIKVKKINKIKRWAANHHEHLDGSGYPFGLSSDKLCTGSRVMMVADKFTALTEDRPYRKGMSQKQVTNILNDLADSGKIDKGMVNLLLEDYNSFDHMRSEIQNNREKEYSKLVN
ncbi:HD domain-containing protein [Halanaerobiaceae bacterium Z-7014]|uniref:HD domain-containing protein n=1 Tax=Halonatronomonas betaini TaxID=2778430 RepID=A0A931ASZ2_9FIRM|nr:HD domain-containing phosphohydrolase [Halonatronomonas betaini]MBF8437331.1 HD domain-containing protein [Halonatronomonas betaini]